MAKKNTRAALGDARRALRFFEKIGVLDRPGSRKAQKPPAADVPILIRCEPSPAPRPVEATPEPGRPAAAPSTQEGRVNRWWRTVLAELRQTAADYNGAQLGDVAAGRDAGQAGGAGSASASVYELIRYYHKLRGS